MTNLPVTLGSWVGRWCSGPGLSGEVGRWFRKVGTTVLDGPARLVLCGSGRLRGMAHSWKCHGPNCRQRGVCYPAWIGGKPCIAYSSQAISVLEFEPIRTAPLSMVAFPFLRSRIAERIQVRERRSSRILGEMDYPVCLCSKPLGFPGR